MNLFRFYWGILMAPDIVTNSNKQIICKLSLRQMPLIGLVSSMVYGLFESSVIVALPIYGLRNNFTSNEVSFF